MNRQSGFTLIELMIVVAIIAILSAVAAPAYLDYVARAQVSEGLGLAASAKAAIVEFYSDKGTFPNDNGSAGMFGPASISGRYVQSVTVRPSGRIEVMFTGSANTRIAGRTLVLSARDNVGSVNWECSGIDRRFLPSPCD